MRELRWQHFGRVPYADATALQRRVHGDVVAGTAPDTILTLEHEPVVTLGRRAPESHVLASRDHLRSLGIELVETDRGGEATWHGPGQLVVYAMVATTRHGIGVSDLVRGLAGAIGDVLDPLGIAAEWDDAHPGLWVDGAKICAVGMRVTRGVSMHGAALNVTASLDGFRLIVPCGMPGAQATSLAALGFRPPPLAALAADVVGQIARRFSVTELRVGGVAAPTSEETDAR